MGTKKLARLIPCLGLLPALGQAVSLGEASIRSYLMEPLVVEIPLGARDQTEIDDLRLRLAPWSDFERFGIERQRLHDELRLEVERRGTDWWLLVRSLVPVREPFFSFPVQALWPDGQMVREYTVFLDPRPIRRQATATARPAPPAPTPLAQTPARQVYGPVQRGETLWPIAQRLKPAGVSTEEMMMALLRANPEAFVGGNVNNLRARSLLRMPTAEDLAAATASDARGAFAQQTAVWRSETAGTEVKPPAPSQEPDVTPAPAVAATPAPESPELRILERAQQEAVPAEPTQTVVSDTDDVERRLLLTLETAEATRLEFQSLKEQVDQLQAQMEDMRRLLSLKDRQIAAIEAMRDGTPPPASDAGVSRPAQTASGPATSPALARLPGAETPGASGRRELIENWWLGVAAAVSALLLLALVAVWGRRRRGRFQAPPKDAQPLESPDRPYASQVAAFHAASAGAAAAATMPRAGHADDTQRFLDDLEQKTAAPPRPKETAPLRKLGPGALDDEDLQLADLELANPTADRISDADLESWAKDLAEEPQTEASGETTMEDLLADLQPEEFDDRRQDFDLDLQFDPLDSPQDVQPAANRGRAVPGGAEGNAPGQGQPSDDFDPEAIELKLELARAYIDIGETEGAREILQQVVEATLAGEQRNEALALLESLS